MNLAPFKPFSPIVRPARKTVKRENTQGKEVLRTAVAEFASKRPAVEIGGPEEVEAVRTAIVSAFESHVKNLADLVGQYKGNVTVELSKRSAPVLDPIARIFEKLSRLGGKMTAANQAYEEARQRGLPIEAEPMPGAPIEIPHPDEPIQKEKDFAAHSKALRDYDLQCEQIDTDNLRLADEHEKAVAIWREKNSTLEATNKQRMEDWHRGESILWKERDRAEEAFNDALTALPRIVEKAERTISDLMSEVEWEALEEVELPKLKWEPEEFPPLVPPLSSKPFLTAFGGKRDGKSAPPAETKVRQPDPAPAVRIIGSAAILGRSAQATRQAEKILSANIGTSPKAVKAAKLAAKKALEGIESRYGRRVKQAVAVGTLLSLPMPSAGTPNAAPIIAFAEMHRHALAGKSMGADIGEEKTKQLVRHVLSKVFPGRLPNGINPDAAFLIPEVKRWDYIEKRYPSLRTKDIEAARDTAIFDDSKLYMRAIISSDQLDRDHEILVPKGCDWSDATQYLPWFLNHQQFPFPIGSFKEDALDPESPPDVHIDGKFVWGGCYFNQETPEAGIAYRLWKIGHLRATSVGFENVADSIETIQGRDAEEKYGASYVRIHHKWKLVECSIIGIGANREAMAMHNSRGHVEKERIPDSMKGWFGSFAMPTKLFRAGFGFPLDAKATA